MQLSGISANDTAFGAVTNASTDSLGKDSFMTLLVEQLKNQDPLKPTANEQFVAELANFSTLEEMEELNENILGMVVLQQSNALLSQLTESSALIGQQVKFFDFGTQSVLEGEVESVKIEDGLALLRVNGQDVPLANVTQVLGESDGEGDDADTADDE